MEKSIKKKSIKKNSIKKNSLYWVLLRITVLPIMLLSVVIIVLGTKSFADSMNQEVRRGLSNLCNTILTLYDNMYVGDYGIAEQGESTCIMKGSHPLNDNLSIIDEIKGNTGVDVTFFSRDIRIATTVTDDMGNRVIGTKASQEVVEDVLEGGNETFYSSVLINGNKYFAYYVPLFGEDGACVGMIFVGKPVSAVQKLVWDAVKPIILIAGITMLIAAILTVSFSEELISAIRKIELFLKEVTSGNLHTELNSVVLKRRDELGEMSRHIVQMQMSLRTLVEQDALTGLNNRRSGRKLLKEIQNEFVEKGVPFCVAIGDIDYFKQVNDTYGHECGDMVLGNIAQILKTQMKGKGFAARWGGEEFLLVFKGYYMDSAVEYIEELLDEIRNANYDYRSEAKVNVTMTFGVVSGNGEKLDNIIRDADAKLYYGKNNGRNQIAQ